ncbi:hypothetical protein TSAR_015473 [Trichomalopsis sarcophagae]|uniref:Uncharacterized protein n=1 Tax=Trichomalopsis sarcophagae TaxID=543379 RepID=A0A232FAR6_9HYME|nr:hypothetical protein TSAR_015473 [Trichomalopsis sarcophagae]
MPYGIIHGGHDSGNTSICLAATAIPEPEYQFDTATYNSPVIYEMLYDTYDCLCHVVEAYSLGLAE